MVFFYPTKKNLVYVTAFHQKKIVKHEPNSHKSINFTVNNTNLRTSICVTDPNRINSTETQKLSMKQYNKFTCFPKNLKKLIKNNKTGVIFINKSDVHMMKSFLCKKLFASRKFILYSDQQNWDLKYLFLVIINYESCEAYFGKKSESCVWHTYVTVSYCTVLYVHTCNGQTDIINQSGQTLRFRHILYILTCWTSLQGRTSGVWELTPILPSTSIPCKLQ